MANSGAGLSKGLLAMALAAALLGLLGAGCSKDGDGAKVGTTGKKVTSTKEILATMEEGDLDVSKITAQTTNITVKESIHSMDNLVRVVTDPTNYPLDFRSETGSMEGLNKDIMTAIGKETKLTFLYKTSKWETLFHNLDTNYVNMVEGLTIKTPALDEMYLSTVPVYEVRQRAYMLESNRNLKPFEKFDDICNLRTAFMRFTDQEDLYKSRCGDDDGSTKALPKNSNYQVLKALATGEADVGIVPDIIANYYLGLGQVPDMIYLDDPRGKPSYVVWYMKKENLELKTRLDKGIKNLKKKDMIKPIFKKWFKNFDESTYVDAPNKI